MKRSSIFYSTLLVIMVIAAPIGLPAFGQTPVINPKGNQTTAYDILQKEANQTGVSKSTLSPLSIHTDLPTYNQGDTIVMTGHVRDPINATAVTFQIFNSLKNRISIGQLNPSSDGSFTKTFVASGPLWKVAGDYTVVAQYGPYTNTNATFHYNGGDGSTTISKFINSTYAIQSGGQTYNIPYIIKGGTVSSMNILAPQYTLEITVNTNADGSITVTLPRDMIDAKIPPPPNPDANLTGTKGSGYDISQKQLEDDKYIVTVNGKQVTQFTETKNQNVRILSIPFHNGDSKIDIVGTVIIPEFGPIAALVLAIAIISIIAVSAKTGLRFMPKY